MALLSRSAVGPEPGRQLTELYKEHSAEAFRYALHLTGRRADAEDVVQQVFLQAHRHLDAGRELVSPRAWLLTAVKHRAYNLARDRRELPLDNAEPAVRPTDPSCDEAVALAEVRGMLWTLPEAQHQAFVLRHWSGLSQNEIAHVLDTTPSAVESLLARARTALLRSHTSASEACSGVRSRLLQSATPGVADREHIDSCRPCGHAHARLARAANLAGSLALVPGAHVADSIAHLVPGFSAHAATSTAAAAGTTGAGAAGAGSGAGMSGATATWGTTAVSTAGKAAVTAKAVLAAVAATAVVSAVPAARQTVSNLVVRHSAASPHHAARHHAPPVAAPVAAPGEPPVATTSGPAAGGPGGGPPAENPGKHTGAGKGTGKPDAPAGGKPADPGSNKPADPGAGNGNGKPLDPGGGNGNGKPLDPGGGNGNGKPLDPGGNGKGAGNPTGAGGNGTAGGNGAGGSSSSGGNGGGQPAGTGGGGKPAGAGGGKP